MLLPQKNTHQTRWLYPTAVVLVSVFGVVATVYSIAFMNRSNKESLLSRVRTIAQSIDVDDVKSLQGTIDDLQNPAYARVKNMLMRMREVNPDTRFIYLNGIKAGQLFFYADSEPPSSVEYYSPPGEPYPEATVLMRSILAGQSSGFEVSSDKWGDWISAYVPVVDANSQKVIALLGVDVPAQGYIFDVITYGLLPFLLTIFLLVFITGIRSIARREEQYVDKQAEFLSIATHEIRAPLTGIRWATETLMSGSKITDPDLHNAILRINRSCVSLIYIINNFLSISSIEHKEKKTLARQETPLRPLIEGILHSLELTAVAKNVKTEIDTSMSPNLVVVCDPLHVRHVLVNLISNAIKYTLPDTKVSVSYAFENNTHRISVHDHGTGVSGEDQKKIFDGFYRTHSAQNNELPGTGLGLYLARKIARIHDGDISIVSSGAGSTFTFWFRQK